MGSQAHHYQTIWSVQGYNNFWISFLLPKNSLLMLRMKVIIYRPMQALWIMLFCVLAWLWWSFLMGRVLGMPYQTKVCQYATTNEKVSHGLSYASISTVEVDIQKCITWPKKFGKGRFTWDKACMDSSLRPRKLSTHVKTRYDNSFMCRFLLISWTIKMA
jgi:hypothetical protein